MKDVADMENARIKLKLLGFTTELTMKNHQDFVYVEERQESPKEHQDEDQTNHQIENDS